MLRLLILMVLPAAAQQLFELDGRVQPEAQASVSIYGVSAPFAGDTLSDAAGHFKFKKLIAGSYTIAALVPGRGEARTTVDIGPGNADSRHRVRAVLKWSDTNLAGEAQRHDTVSARQLAIPESAHHEFSEAQKALARRDSTAAAAHLERAVQIAPQFELAWNNLGTIAYRNQQYPRAADCFRRALAANPQAYEPLVNLGGVLINLGQFDEALCYNRHAVLLRPDDALGNSQLGLTFFELHQLDPAEKYLERARQLDPAHFSHPQLLLAEIHAARGQPLKAADDLDEFLRYHPDSPDASRLRAEIARLRAQR